MRWWDKEFTTDLVGLFFIVAFSAMAGAGTMLIMLFMAGP